MRKRDVIEEEIIVVLKEAGFSCEIKDAWEYTDRYWFRAEISQLRFPESESEMNV